ncbi:MAG: hypothetical protein L0332_17830 [Chloroflexi bacterium]|nr:hypothetical protein [Chloroflexota bacterium]
MIRYLSQIDGATVHFHPTNPQTTDDTYGGRHAADSAVAYRWRLDRVFDTSLNEMVYQYVEFAAPQQGYSFPNTPANNLWERESHLDTIQYAYLNATQWGYRVKFNKSSRTTTGDGWQGDDYGQLFAQTYFLDSIAVQSWANNQVNTIREYDLVHIVGFKEDLRASYIPTRLLSQVIPYGADGISGGNALPATFFEYELFDNKARQCIIGVAPCEFPPYPPEWNLETFPYARLIGVRTETGASTYWGYERFDRPDQPLDYLEYYLHRVHYKVTHDGQGGTLLTSYHNYGTPVFQLDYGEGISHLVGFPEVTESRLNPATGALLGRTKTFFRTDTAVYDEVLQGRIYTTETYDSADKLRQQVVTDWAWGTTNSFCPLPGRPAGVQFPCPYRVKTYLYDTNGVTLLKLLMQTSYWQTASQGGSQYGNVTEIQEWTGVDSDPNNVALYRKQFSYFNPNTTDTVWIVGKPYLQVTQSAAGANLAATHFRYDDKLATDTSMGTQGRLTRSRVWDSSTGGGSYTDGAFKDTTFIYDSYGNLTEMRAYESTSGWTTIPQGTYRSIVTDYDTTYHLFPVASHYPLSMDSTTAWDYAYARVTGTTDPNTATTSFFYDGRGRLDAIRRPYDESGSPTVDYEYTLPDKDPSYVLPNNADFERNDSNPNNCSSGWGSIDLNGLDCGSAFFTAGNSVRLTRDASNNHPNVYMYQILGQVPNGVTLYVSAFIKDAGGHTPAVVRLTGIVQEDAGTYAAISGSGDGWVTATSGWTQIGGVYNVTAAGTLRLNVELKNLGLQHRVYVDHFHIERVDIPALAVTQYLRTSSTETLWNRTLYDSLGRAIQAQGEWTVANQAAVTDTRYGVDGQVSQQSVAYQATPPAVGDGYYVYPSGAANWTTTEYDELRRLWRVTNVDGTDSEFYYTYQAWQLGQPNLYVQGQIDANNHSRQQAYDDLGRMVGVREFTGTTNPYTVYATTWYNYDHLDRLASVQDALGNTTTLTYDGWGNKATMIDPDMGAWEYSYGLFGNLIRQEDNKNPEQVICFYYDDLNRELGRKYYPGGAGACPASPSAYDVTFLYDENGHGAGEGRLTSVTDLSGAASYTYDLRGRLTQTTRTITWAGESRNYTLSATYDSADRLLAQTLPGGEVVTTGYDSAGRPTNLQAGADWLVDNATYNVRGQLEFLDLGNSTTTDYQYFPASDAFRLSRLETDGPAAGLLQDLNYTYDDVGNVLTIFDDNIDNTQTFTYDDLDRLKTASAPAAGGVPAYNYTYSYNQIGNISSDGSRAYSYNDTNHKHAVTSLDSLSGNEATFTYDANGNMVTRSDSTGSYTQNFDIENRLASVTKAGAGTTTFTYDANGQRMLTVKPDGTLILTPFPNYEEEIRLEESVIGEVGQITTLTHTPQTVILSRSYQNPVVFAQPISRNESDTAVVRITSVQSDRFTFYVHEAPNMNGSHSAETVSYVVLEAGSWDLPNGSLLQVGKLDTAQFPQGTTWMTVSFGSAFSAAPVVMSQVQTNNDTHWVKTRQRNTTTTNFQVRLEEEEVKTTLHGGEMIGWLAIAPSKGSWGGHAYEAGQTADAVTHAWYQINFSQSFSSDTITFLAMLATYDDADNAHLRYNGPSLTPTGVQVMVEEDTTADPETSHGTEVVHFLAIEDNGTLTAMVDSPAIKRKLYALGGQPIALRINGDPIAQYNGLFYIHTDHLGSNSLLSYGQGQTGPGTLFLGSEARYLPFGGYRGTPPTTNPALTDRGYTGHKHNNDLGLVYMNARFYLPGVGRFASADSIVPNAANPQSLNRYSYVLNNPFNFTDPTGHSETECGVYSEECDGLGGSEQGTASSDVEPIDVKNEYPTPVPEGLPPSFVRLTIEFSRSVGDRTFKTTEVFSGVAIDTNAIMTHNHVGRGFSPADIVLITITDAAGNVLLVATPGDFAFVDGPQLQEMEGAFSLFIFAEDFIEASKTASLAEGSVSRSSNGLSIAQQAVWVGAQPGLYSTIIIRSENYYGRLAGETAWPAYKVFPDLTVPGDSGAPLYSNGRVIGINEMGRGTYGQVTDIALIRSLITTYTQLLRVW